jgi:hypothetical protein
MKADQPVTVPGTPNVPTPTNVNLPGAHHGALPAQEEPSTMLVWLKSTWERLKTGQVGSPKILALLVSLALIAGAWYFYSYATKKQNSARWVASQSSVDTESLKTLAADPGLAKTPIGNIASLNLARDTFTSASKNLLSGNFTERQKAAKSLEDVREEMTTLGGKFSSDKSLQATCWLLAADAELALVGVPKEGIQAVGLQVKENGRGQVERVVELKKKVATLMGADTAIGKKLNDEADKLTKDIERVYKANGIFHSAFNEAPTTRPAEPIIPIGENK